MKQDSLLHRDGPKSFSYIHIIAMFNVKLMLHLHNIPCILQFMQITHIAHDSIQIRLYRNGLQNTEWTLFFFAICSKNWINNVVGLINIVFISKVSSNSSTDFQIKQILIFRYLKSAISRICWN